MFLQKQNNYFVYKTDVKNLFLFICYGRTKGCSTYGNPRSKDFHFKYLEQLLKYCGLPDIRFHDLKATYCTLLLKNNFSSKVVSQLFGHSSEFISVDVY